MIGGVVLIRKHIITCQAIARLPEHSFTRALGLEELVYMAISYCAWKRVVALKGLEHRDRLINVLQDLEDIREC